MADHVNLAIEFLKNSEGYDCKGILGKGTYGSVIKICKEGGVKAAKIIENRVVNMLEIREWPKLNHENVLSLLEIIFRAECVVIFITELMNTNLFTLLQNKDFKNDIQAPEKCRLFARQIFSGMAYLHDLKLCHLDLRAENVFVASDDKVVVADFSGLSFMEEMKKFCPLPHSLRPPEMLLPKKAKAAPLPIDLWACGLILAHMFLGRGYYIITVKNPKAGHVEAVNQYTDCFKSKKYVTPFINQNYPNSHVSDSRVTELIALISLFLQLNPKLRISAVEALEHSFLLTPVMGMSEKMSSEMVCGTEITQESSVCDGEVRNELLPPTTGGDLIQETANNERKKSKWTKYRPSFLNIRKLYASSPPLFRSKNRQNRI